MKCTLLCDNLFTLNCAFSKHTYYVYFERKDFMSWRDDPITPKQKEYIADLLEFSLLPLEEFTGTTRGEAADWIDRNADRAHDRSWEEGHQDIP